MTYEEIVQGLRDSTYELQTEGRQVRAGLKTEQDTASVIERYAWLYSDEALRVIDGVAANLQGPAAEAHKRVRIAVMHGMIERRTAPQNDRLTTFYATAQTRVGGEALPFFTAQTQLMREGDPGRRDALGEAVAAVMEQAEELSLELQRLSLEVIRSLGYDSYIGFWSTLKEVDYGPLLQELRTVADSARASYRSWVEPRMRTAGYAFGACPQWHVSYFRGAGEHDAAFPAERFEAAMRRTFDRLGLELFSAPTIHIDLADRPAKNPRASVWVPEAGREVHLLTRPTGGHHDYAAFLHEAGHALHFGLADPAIGWPLANLGRSMAYAELWSYLIERIGHDPTWLAETLELPAEDAERISGDLTGVDLMMFTRYVGKLTYELELHAGDALQPDRGRRLYSSVLTQATAFQYDPRAWQFDRDDGFYSADYLRAWLAEAALEEGLRERFGDRWWASPESGRWLREQWRKGWLPEAEETVAEIGARPWSGEYLARNFERRLALVS